MKLNFVAINVAAANSNPGSICAVAMVQVTNSRIADKQSFLVKPHASIGVFTEEGMNFNGIRPEHVVNAIEWRDALDKVVNFVKGDYLVVHDPRFDVSAIRSATDALLLSHPHMTYFGIRDLIKKSFPTLHNQSPIAIAEALGMSTEGSLVVEKNALSTALTCIRITEHTRATGIASLMNSYRIAEEIIGRGREHARFHDDLPLLGWSGHDEGRIQFPPTTPSLPMTRRQRREMESHNYSSGTDGALTVSGNNAASPDSVGGNLNDFQQQMLESDRTIRELRLSLTKKNDEMTVMQSTHVTALNDQAKSYKKMLSGSGEGDVTGLASKLREQNKLSETLQKRLQVSSSEMQKLAIQNASFEARLKTQKENIERLTLELRGSRAKSQQAEEATRLLSVKLSSGTEVSGFVTLMREENSSLTRLNSSLSRDIGLLKIDCEEGEKEADNLRKKLASLRVLLEKKTDDIAILQSDNKALSASHENSAAELSKLLGIHEIAVDLIRRFNGSDLLAMEEERKNITNELPQLRKEFDSLRDEIAWMTDTRIAADVGFFDFDHVAQSSVLLADKLADTRTEMKEMIRSKTACTYRANFTFNGSTVDGRKFCERMMRIMLNAYNAEAENAVKSLRGAGTSSSAKSKIEKSLERVTQNGEMIGLKISRGYHALKLREVDLAAQHLLMKKAEQEDDRQRREEQREQDRALQELREEHARLEKERQHYVNTLRAVQAKGDDEAVARMQEKIEEIDDAIENVDSRTANTRAGHVYIISNVGAFGEGIVKIGMTRRLEPMDRVKELGDASVPFRFDTHALFFAEDAVGVENILHKHFAPQRVNRVNLRREFFYTTPHAVLEALKEHNVEVVEFKAEFEAEEYRVSQEIMAAEKV